jgi:hypothetical protein
MQALSEGFGDHEQEKGMNVPNIVMVFLAMGLISIWVHDMLERHDWGTLIYACCGAGRMQLWCVGISRIGDKMKYWFICEVVGHKKIISKRYATDAEIQEVLSYFPYAEAFDVDKETYDYMSVGDAW